jgi:hypothetical protein
MNPDGSDAGRTSLAAFHHRDHSDHRIAASMLEAVSDCPKFGLLGFENRNYGRSLAL